MVLLFCLFWVGKIGLKLLESSLICEELLRLVKCLSLVGYCVLFVPTLLFLWNLLWPCWRFHFANIVLLLEIELICVVCVWLLPWYILLTMVLHSLQSTVHPLLLCQCSSGAAWCLSPMALGHIMPYLPISFWTGTYFENMSSVMIILFKSCFDLMMLLCIFAFGEVLIILDWLLMVVFFVGIVWNMLWVWLCFAFVFVICLFVFAILLGVVIGSAGAVSNYISCCMFDLTCWYSCI